MGCRQPVLVHAPFMRIEHFQPEHLGRPPAGKDACEPVTEIAVALHTVVLWHGQVQRHQLVALARMLECLLVGGYRLSRLGSTGIRDGVLDEPIRGYFARLDLLHC